MFLLVAPLFCKDVIATDLSGSQDMWLLPGAQTRDHHYRLTVPRCQDNCSVKNNSGLKSRCESLQGARLKAWTEETGRLRRRPLQKFSAAEGAMIQRELRHGPSKNVGSHTESGQGNSPRVMVQRGVAAMGV